MDIVRSDIVKSTAGRDKGKYFFVLAEEEEFLLLAAGKTRKLERPKRKKRKHTAFAARSQCGVAGKTARDEKIPNSELIKTLASLRVQGPPAQEV